MVKKELEEGMIYIVCPDKNCKIFYDSTSYPGADCYRDCPQKEKMTQLAKCFLCKEILDLGFDHSKLQHISHRCSDGRNPTMFYHKYSRIFK